MNKHQQQRMPRNVLWVAEHLPPGANRNWALCGMWILCQHDPAASWTSSVGTPSWTIWTPIAIFIATRPSLLFANKAVFYPSQRGFWHSFESRHSNNVLFTIGSVQPTYSAILCMFTQKSIMLCSVVLNCKKYIWACIWKIGKSINVKCDLHYYIWVCNM